MASAPQQQGQGNASPKPLRRQRLKVSNACQVCRLRKVKCDGGLPACTRCRARGKTCTYDHESTTVAQEAKRRHSVRNPQPIRPSSATSPALGAHASQTLSVPVTGIALTSATETSSTLPPSPGPQGLDRDQDSRQDQESPCYIAHGRFSGQVEAAIDVRAGLVPATTSNLVPFVDAPLFGEIDLDSASHALSCSTELPPRAYADRLVGIYWQHVHAVEPILDRTRFFRDYEASYSGADTIPREDRDIWFSILNTVFALAAQRQESILMKKRDEEGNYFFQRAWALIRPETILWKPGSIELVQCLMLLNRYIHCTENRHKTWMTAGLAMRTAQSMCCHVSQSISAGKVSDEARIWKQVWVSCIGLDRCVSWSLGRSSAPVLITSPSRTEITSLNDQVDDRSFTRALELHEIGNQIQLAQTEDRNNLATRLGLPRHYQHDNYPTVAVELDACLDRWENSLPSDWKLQNLREVADRTSRAERYLLHLR
ncbi:hypothetical protein NCS56_00200600 [Fusarium sp. Ph1]|nr:hypothetical protein NCS56_00200600 [Fusarium sp. Ph1]